MTTLTIPAAQLSDSGQYICNATLGNEERSTTFSFAVRGKHSLDTKHSPFKEFETVTSFPGKHEKEGEEPGMYIGYNVRREKFTIHSAQYCQVAVISWFVFPRRAFKVGKNSPDVAYYHHP